MLDPGRGNAKGNKTSVISHKPARALVETPIEQNLGPNVPKDMATMPLRAWGERQFAQP